MSSTSRARVAHPAGAPGRRGRAARLSAAVTAITMGSALALAAPLSAGADEQEVFQTFAVGQFLSGRVLGIDLSNIVSVGPAEATNNGTQPDRVEKDPLDVTVLNTVSIKQPIQLDLGQFLDLGAISQYAEANNDGTSMASSGALTDDGGIGVGPSSTRPLGDVTLDLSKLLGPEFASTIADLKLVLLGLAAQATANADVAAGDYWIDRAVLKFTSPAIADLSKRVAQALQTVENELTELTGRNGELLAVVNRIVQAIDPLLDLAGANASVSATISHTEFMKLVSDVLRSEYGNNAVRFNLETGEVTVDLEALHGGTLNDLPPNTELLTPEIVNRILTGITSTVSTLADQILAKVTNALRNAVVDIRADVSLDVAQAPIVKTVCNLVDEIVTTPVLSAPLDPVTALLKTLERGLSGLNQVPLLSSLLGDGLLPVVGDLVKAADGTVREVIGFATSTVQREVCSDEQQLLPPLTTSIDLDLHASIAELLNGRAATATAKLKVLGVETGLDLGVVLGELGELLRDTLFDGDGAVSKLTRALHDLVVSPAVKGLLGPSSGPVAKLLTSLLSIKVNVQHVTPAGGGSGFAAMATAGGAFTQTAMQVNLANAASLSLASASVGPNVMDVVDDPNDPNDPDGPGDPGNPGGPGDPTTPTATDRLALTGVGIATLVAVILALLAAGAYLLRESSRRNRSTVLVE